MHRIRLRHPWKSEVQDGCVRWSRSFNWPADNTSDETIYLAIRPWPADATIVLNDQSLSADETTSRCVVTSILRESNRLQVSLPTTTCADSDFPLEVQLEIEESV